MRILAIGAHPDDIEFGCGGTLIKYARQGHDVSLLVMTDGGGGGDGRIRRQEQQAAGDILGVSRLFWGEYPDTAIPLDRESIQRVERVILDVRPDFIFVHSQDDTHQDHRHLSVATITATRYTRNVLFYEGPTTQNFSPNVFVEIDGVLQDKIAALQAHKSQVTKTNIEGMNILDIVQSSAHFRGIQGRVRNAEAFVPLRLFINITS
ncbi:MAG: PIG-L family deacetylase [candidate division NC10 bacterium]|nr:PIG-L family deacetylase [candidate division NC10 bacterium]